MAAADIRYALRGIRRHPGWAATAVLTLALGIGANAAMFGIVDRLLLRAPPHIEDPRRLARLDLEYADGSGGRFTMSSTSYPVFEDLRRVPAFRAVAAASSREMAWGAGEQARAVRGSLVTGDYFAALGVRAAKGRLPGADDDRAPDGAPVALLGHAFWRREFGGSDSVLGQAIELDDTRYTIVGIAPAGFTGDELAPVDLWVPFSAAMAGKDPSWRTQRGMRLLRIVARLPDESPGPAAEQASAALRAGLEGLPNADSTARVVPVPLAQGWSAVERATSQGRIAVWLAGMSVIVLLIAVVNVANLMLYRVAERRREFAVRLALGAPRGRLATQLVVESLTLVALGGVAALFVAAWGGEWVRLVLVPGLAGAERLVDARLFAITAAGTLVAGLLAGLGPAARAGRASVTADLATGGGAAGAPRAMLAPALLVIQAGLCVILLAGAGAFVLSLHRVRTQDLGFRAEGVLLANAKFPAGITGAAQDARYREAAERLRRLPGVEAVSEIQALPFEGHNVPPIAVPGRPDFPDLTQQAPFLNAATPSYFRALGMTLREGRNFTDADRDGAPLVIIINEAMARGLWPRESALGKCIRAGFLPGQMPSGLYASPALPCREVIGVVNNARPRSIREEAGQAQMMYYLPFDQVPRGPFDPNGPAIWGLIVRASNADEAAPAVQRLLQSPDLGATLATVRPFQDSIDRQIRPFVLGASMFTVFGVLALLLAAIGLYGVRAYAVSQRSREIGVRIALGAGSRSVVRMVVMEGVRLAGAGVVIGVVVVALLAERLEPVLFETSYRDPLMLAGVAVLLIVVAIAASAVPAMRAARVDPNVALRAE